MNLHKIGLALGALLFSVAGVAETQTQLEKIIERGSVEVAAYKEFAPYSYRAEGRRAGIDLEIAELVAEHMGVNLASRLIGVDENMEDDLRNNIWKGHYIGGGVADFMVHVPYDPEFSAANDLVSFVAPYYRESLAFALNPETAGSIQEIADIDQHLVGVELDTLADFYLLSPRYGNLRENVVHFANLSEAAQAFAAGEINLIAGPAGELEGILRKAGAEFELKPMQIPGLRSTGWDIGLAVRFNHKGLITAIISAMADLRESGAIAAVFKRHGVTYRDPSAPALASGYQLP